MTTNSKINAAAVKYLGLIRERAIKDGIRATKAVEMLIEKFPTLTRAETYYSAEEVGINRLTARNVYDRMKPPVPKEEKVVVIADRRATTDRRVDD